MTEHMMTIDQEIEAFNDLTAIMNKIFASKRKDYGQNTEDLCDKYGMVAMIIKLNDKLSRLENLLVFNQKNMTGEKVEDTLLDMANYALITLLEYRKRDLRKMRGSREVKS